MYNSRMSNDAPLFELNDTILERIIFAMEDQTKSQAVDLRSGELAAKQEGEAAQGAASPPEWTPADGFRLMESFCARVTTLEAKRALLKSLSHGKGVFKAFRQALASYPQEESRFREYKNTVLRRRIEVWMDDIREAQGFARMGPEPEEYEDLVDEEFAIEYGGLENLPFDMAALVEEAGREALAWLPAAAASLEKAETIAFLDASGPAGFALFIAEAKGRPIAAAAGAVTQKEGRSLSLVRFLYAAKDFRELGLEYRLLDRIHTINGEKGVEHTLLRSLFLRPGFVESLRARGLKALETQFLLN